MTKTSTIRLKKSQAALIAGILLTSLFGGLTLGTTTVAQADPGLLSLAPGKHTLWFRDGSNVDGVGMPTVDEEGLLSKQPPTGTVPVVHSGGDFRVSLSLVDEHERVPVVLTSKPLDEEVQLGDDASVLLRFSGWTYTSKQDLSVELQAIDDVGNVDPIAAGDAEIGWFQDPHIGTTLNIPLELVGEDNIVQTGDRLQLTITMVSALVQSGLFYSILYDSVDFDSHLNISVAQPDGQGPVISEFTATDSNPVTFSGSVTAEEDPIENVTIDPGDDTGSRNATLDGGSFTLEHDYGKAGEWIATAVAHDENGRTYEVSAKVVIEGSNEDDVIEDITGPIGSVVDDVNDQIEQIQDFVDNFEPVPEPDGFLAGVRTGPDNGEFPLIETDEEGNFELHVIALRQSDSSERWRGSTTTPYDIEGVLITFVPGVGGDGGSSRWERTQNDPSFLVELPTGSHPMNPTNHTVINVADLPQADYGFRIIVEEVGLPNSRISEHSMLKDPYFWTGPHMSPNPGSGGPNERNLNTLDQWEAVYSECQSFTPVFIDRHVDLSEGDFEPEECGGVFGNIPAFGSQIESSTEPNPPQTGEDVNFTAEVTPEPGQNVSRVEIEYIFELADGDKTDPVLTNMTRQENETWSHGPVGVPDDAVNSTYTIRAFEENEEGEEEIATTGEQEVSIEDAIDPRIEDFRFDPQILVHNETFEIVVNATDNIGVESVKVQVGDDLAYELEQQDGSRWNVTVSSGIEKENYSVEVTVEDEGDNLVKNTTEKLKVEPFQIIDNSNVGDLGTGDLLNFTAEPKRGGSSVGRFELVYDFELVDGSLIDKTVSNEGDELVHEKEVPKNAVNLTYTIRAFNKTNEKIATTGEQKVSINDTIDPVIEDFWFDPPSPVEHKQFEIKVQATDNIGIKSVVVDVGANNYVLIAQGGSLWNITVSSGIGNGNYEVEVMVEDEADNRVANTTEELVVTEPRVEDLTETQDLETESLVTFLAEMAQGGSSVTRFEVGYRFRLADESVTDLETGDMIEENGNWSHEPVEIPFNATGLLYTITSYDGQDQQVATTGEESVLVEDAIDPKFNGFSVVPNSPKRVEPFEVRLDATDNIGVEDVRVKVKEGDQIRKDIRMALQDSEWVVNVNPGLWEGDYGLTFEMEDDAGNRLEMNRTLVVVPPDAAEVMDATDPEDLKTGGAFLFEADVAEGDGAVTNVEIEYFFVHPNGIMAGLPVTDEMSSSDQNAYQYGPVSIPEDVAAVTYRVTAADDNNRHGTLLVDNATIEDTIPPAIQDLWVVPEQPKAEEPFTVFVAAADNIVVDAVDLEDAQSEETIEGNRVEGTWRISLEGRDAGNHPYEVTARDRDGNEASTFVTVNVRPLMPPTFSNHKLYGNLETGGSASFEAVVAQGDAEISRVEATYTIGLGDGGTTEDTLILSNAGNRADTYEAGPVDLPENAVRLETNLTVFDRNGLTSEVSVKHDVNDTLSPRITRLRVDPAAPKEDDEFQVTVEARDNLDIKTLEIRVLGSQLDPLEATLDKQTGRWKAQVEPGTLPEGGYALVATAADEAGNEASSERTTLVVGDPDPVARSLTAQVVKSLTIETTNTSENGEERHEAKLKWEAPPGAAGFQVWRSTSPFELLETLPEGTNRFVDPDATPAAVYVVTAYVVANGIRYGKADDDPVNQIPGFAIAAGLQEDDENTAAETTGVAPVVLGNTNGENVTYRVKLIVKDENDEVIRTEEWTVTVEPGQSVTLDLEEDGLLDGAASHEVVYGRIDKTSKAESARAEGSGTQESDTESSSPWPWIIVVSVILLAAAVAAWLLWRATESKRNPGPASRWDAALASSGNPEAPPSWKP